jgi:hypothetical protein
MAAVLDLDVVSEILLENLSEEQAYPIINALKNRAKQAAEANGEREDSEGQSGSENETKEKKEKVPKKWVILITKESLDEKEPVGFVLQIPEQLPAKEIGPRLRETADEYNGTKKGRKNPVRSIGEIFQYVAPKYFTAGRLWKKTKEAAEVVILSNRL